MHGERRTSSHATTRKSTLDGSNDKKPLKTAHPKDVEKERLRKVRQYPIPEAGDQTQTDTTRLRKTDQVGSKETRTTEHHSISRRHHEEKKPQRKSENDKRDEVMKTQEKLHTRTRDTSKPIVRKPDTSHDVHRESQRRKLRPPEVTRVESSRVKPHGTDVPISSRRPSNHDAIKVPPHKRESDRDEKAMKTRQPEPIPHNEPVRVLIKPHQLLEPHPTMTEPVDRIKKAPPPEEESYEDYGSDFEQASSAESENTVHLERCTNSIDNAQCQASEGFMSFVISSNLKEMETMNKPNINHDSHPKQQVIDFNQLLLSNRGSEHHSHERLKQRATDLMRLIELEFDGTGHLFELKPLDEYANYMVRFGKANRSQTHVQTQDDALDREVQTEVIELCKHGGVWTQWPPLDTGECFGHLVALDKTLDDAYAQHTDSTMEHLLTELTHEFIPRSSVVEADPCILYKLDMTKSLDQSLLRLPSSLSPHMKTMLELLDEEHLMNFHLDDPQDSLSAIKDELSPSSDQSMSYLSGECVACLFAPYNPFRLLTVHRSKEKIYGSFDRKERAGEVIIIWSIRGQLRRPEMCLICPGLSQSGLHEGNVNSSIFSPDLESNMVIGGLTDGSICLWDLHDTLIEKTPSTVSNYDDKENSHKSPTLATISPIYSTCGIEVKQYNSKGTTTRSQSHTTQYQCTAPVVKIQLTHHTSDKPIESNFQFVALDASGVLSLWMVLRQSQGMRPQRRYDNLAGSQVDLGLRPSERTVRMIRLLHVTVQIPRFHFFHPSDPSMSPIQEDETSIPTTEMPSPMKELDCKIQATTLAVTGAGNFVVGFYDGSLIQHARSSGQPIYPRQFQRPATNYAAVICLAIHPEPCMNLLLAGYEDGTICLYHLHYPNTLHQWVTPFPDSSIHRPTVCQLSWSPVQGTSDTFFVLDSTYRLSRWNVQSTIENYNSPFGKCLIDIDSVSDKSDEASTRLMEDDFNVREFSIATSAPMRVDGQRQNMTAIAVLTKGAVRIHWFGPDWCDVSSSDGSWLNECMNEWLSTQK